MRKGLILLAVLAVGMSSGCFGLFQGYGEAAQEMTSAEYTIGTYKSFIIAYNAICSIGSQTEAHKEALNDFERMHGTDGRAYSRSENTIWSDLRYDYKSSINQYNALAGKYNTMANDKTLDWLKIAGLPDQVFNYDADDHLTTSNVIDEEVLTGLFKDR